MPAMVEATAAKVISNAQILIRAAHTLGVPIVVSQQYPKGLGATVAAIADVLPADAHRFDKLEFSAAAAPAFAELAPGLGRDQWIVCGMESHVCVYQTTRDLIARGWDVHVYDAKAVESQAARLLGDRADAVLYGPRATMGPPWTRDHRVALAATIVAA